MISIRETKDETEFESTLNPNQYDRYDKPDRAMTKKKKRAKPDESNQHTMFSMLTFEEKVSITILRQFWCQVKVWSIIILIPINGGSQ